MKRSYALALFITSTAAFRAQAYDFSQYTPTLGEDSGYILSFNKESTVQALPTEFRVLEKNALGKYESVYYNYGIQAKLGVTSSNRVTSGTNILGNFFDKTGNLLGLAISNDGSGKNMNLIQADFWNLKNTASYGGAIFNANGAKIGDIKGDFISNSIVTSGNAYGGAIENNNTDNAIGTITGNFIGNSVTGSRYTLGGAIFNSGTITSINGLFANNSVKRTTTSAGGQGGGAIFSNGSTISELRGDFFSNYIDAATAGEGGAISASSINYISANFISNYIKSASGNANGGGIAVSTQKIENSLFLDNHIISQSGIAQGGALFSHSTGLTEIINSDFIRNYASSATGAAKGGAIFSQKGDLIISADGYNSLFQDNYIDVSGNKTSSAIYMNSNKTLSLNSINGGSIVMNDQTDGSGYSLNISGDNSGALFLNNKINNAADISINNTTVKIGKYESSLDTALNGIGNFDTSSNLSLTNSIMDMNNGFLSSLDMKNFSSTSGTIILNIQKTGNIWNSDLLNIAGNVSGQTNLVVHSLSPITTYANEQLIFASAPNDTLENNAAFTVHRVYGDAYMWESARNVAGNEIGSVWYLKRVTKANPDYIPPEPEPDPSPEPDSVVTPEVMAYRGIISASLEQTKGMINNIRNKVAANKILSQNCCGLYDESWNGKSLYNPWISSVYNTSYLSRPVSMQSDIWGIEAGFDIQSSIHNKIGVFASYRKGDYGLSGKGSLFSSPIASDIEINSYIGGLYYRYDKRNLWVFATAYSGIQKTQIKTDDSVHSKTDGNQLGSSIEIGKTYAINKSLTIEPAFGAFYTQIDFDDASDNMGKTAKYDTLRQTELEAGIKLEKTLYIASGITKFYVRPSLIQPITSGDSPHISSLGKTKSYTDRTLGKAEVGTRFNLDENLAAYAFANYTYGSKYQASSLGFGLNYAW